MTATLYDRRAITVEQFVAMSDDVTDHYELVEGELIEVSSATPKNSIVRDNLLVVLKISPSLRNITKSLSEVDVRTFPSSVRRPDIAIFSAEQIGRFNMNAVPIPEPPMIAVEVLSPSEGMMAVGRKVAEYLATGSREVWLVDHLNREIHIRTIDGERLLVAGKTLESDLLPGFSVAVNDLFEV